MRWGAGGKTGRDCTTLGDAQGELALTAPKCPDWVLPNAGEVGYYRMLPTPDLLAKLLAHTKQLTLAERVGVLGDVGGLIASGDVQNSLALGLVADQAKDTSRQIVGASIGIVAGIDDMVPDKLRPNYERFIRKLYRARAVELGWTAKPGESEDAKQLRPTLLALVAGDGNDPELIKQATALAWKWLDDHKAVDAELRQHGAARRVALWRSEAVRPPARGREEGDRPPGSRAAARRDGRVRGSEDRPAGARDRDHRRVRSSRVRGAAQRRLHRSATRETSFAFVKQHFDEILAKLPPMYRPYMASIAVPLCDSDRRPELEAFLKPKIEPLDGGPRALAQALEELDLCSAARKAQTPGVIAFLSKQ